MLDFAAMQVIPIVPDGKLPDRPCNMLERGVIYYHTWWGGVAKITTQDGVRAQQLKNVTLLECYREPSVLRQEERFIKLIYAGSSVVVVNALGDGWSQHKVDSAELVRTRKFAGKLLVAICKSVDRPEQVGSLFSDGTYEVYDCAKGEVVYQGKTDELPDSRLSRAEIGLSSRSLLILLSTGDSTVVVQDHFGEVVSREAPGEISNFQRDLFCVAKTHDNFEFFTPWDHSDRSAHKATCNEPGALMAGEYLWSLRLDGHDLVVRRTPWFAGGEEEERTFSLNLESPHDHFSPWGYRYAAYSSGKLCVLVSTYKLTDCYALVDFENNTVKTVSVPAPSSVHSLSGGYFAIQSNSEACWWLLP